MTSKIFIALGLLVLATGGLSVGGALREENFDREPPNWEGINNRNQYFPVREVRQDFGYTNSSKAGGQPGEIGGLVNPAGEAAYYACRLPSSLSLDSELEAEGRLFVQPGPGHFMLGFFNTDSLNEWRTPNSLLVRVNSRGESSHFHFEYCTDRWRAGAGVIGEIVPGERISAKDIPNGRSYRWKMSYKPGSNGEGILTFALEGMESTCIIEKDHRGDGIKVTHFGLLPITKTWDSPGSIWVDDVSVNGKRFDFSTDPKWEEFNNRRIYMSKDTRPKFDFGWSPTGHAKGNRAGELGGLIFRGDCREPARMGAYGDRIELVSLRGRLEARGKVCMLRGITDSTASIGFYHSKHSMTQNPSQKHSIPMNYLGINIEGPSSEGFFFYPVYRVNGDEAGAASGGQKPPRIYPDGISREWFLVYDPEGANGRGTMTVGLDDATFTMELGEKHKEKGASFDRFGICTPWIDGNSVTLFFDDLSYTVAQE